MSQCAVPLLTETPADVSSAKRVMLKNRPGDIFMINIIIKFFGWLKVNFKKKSISSITLDQFRLVNNNFIEHLRNKKKVIITKCGSLGRLKERSDCCCYLKP